MRIKRKIKKERPSLKITKKYFITKTQTKE